MRTGISVTLAAADRTRLEAVVANRNSPQKHVWRARIVLLTADGVGTNAIMRQTAKSKATVWRWQERFMTTGVDGLLRDKTRPARLWEAASGRELAVLRGHEGTVLSAAFSPDGQRVVTASVDGTARLWQVFATTQELIEYARSIVHRELTPDQRWQFFLEESAPEDKAARAPPIIPVPGLPVTADPPE